MVPTIWISSKLPNNDLTFQEHNYLVFLNYFHTMLLVNIELVSLLYKTQDCNLKEGKTTNDTWSTIPHGTMCVNRI